MSEIEIGKPENLHWLWLVAAAACLLLYAIRWTRRAALRFATPNLVDRLLSGRSVWRPLVSAMLLILSLVLLVIGTLDIRWGTVTREVPQTGIEVMFVLDVSRSMLAEDVTPSRLGRAKQMIKDLVDEMVGDRVGLVLFAGEVRQEIPMTSHYDDFKQRLDEVGPEDIDRGGSKLGSAIKVARDGFLMQTNQHKAMVLLTDGEDMESQPIEAAKVAKEESGITIFTIGLGDFEQGARIPIGSDHERSFLQHEGQQVWSKLNGEVLAQVATETGGAYIPAGTKQVNMSDVYHGYIAGVEQQEFEAAKIDGFEARFTWFLAPAIVSLLAELALKSHSPARRASD